MDLLARTYLPLKRMRRTLMRDLKTAATIVVGASRGFGRAIALRLAAEGADRARRCGSAESCLGEPRAHRLMVRFPDSNRGARFDFGSDEFRGVRGS
jgi:NAD(P)-dependent dehydrogenase (short-subunit alcohol dehydrogenase family)